MTFRFPQSFFTILLFATLLPPVAEAEQTWREIRSPHFRVLTDGSEHDGRTVALEFEQMRHVFAILFKNDEIESGAPLTVVAARDQKTFRDLEPRLWKAQGDKIAGEFHRGWEKQFALTRLDTWGDENQVVIYHEYTHSILHANEHWLPTWLDEGVAEFYAYTRFEHDRTLIGAPSRRMGTLRSEPLVPVTTIMGVNSRSPFYRDERKMQLFYAESWAIVHFCMFGPDMGGGEKLVGFMHKLQDGEPQEKAFGEVFGDPKTFDAKLERYLRQFTFKAGVLPADEKMEARVFPSRDLSPAEAAYELACFHIGAHNPAGGRLLLDKALALDPKLAGAHEELAFLEFSDGKDAEAQAEWTRTVTLDPDRPRSLFALTMMGKPLAQQTPGELRATQQALHHIQALAPKFAAPLVELALVEWRLGLMTQAYKDARTAETLEPWRAGYRLLTGQILLHGKQPALAAKYSRYVAGHWFGPDHDEAVDLWNAIPAADRGDGEALAFDLPSGVQTVRGTLTEVSCSAAAGDHTLKVMLQPDEPAGAAPLTFNTNGRLMIGFSDTLWWGEDHFSSCHHLDGHPALLAYKSSGMGGPELVNLEIRDDLPVAGPSASPASSEAPAQAQGKTAGIAAQSTP